MPNPFDSLGAPKPPQVKEPQGEEVGGLFSCDHSGCWEKSKTAQYFVLEQLLRWECPKGHVSALKGFVL